MDRLGVQRKSTCKDTKESVISSVGQSTDAARITEERAGSEDRKHTSRGVFVAIDSNLGAVIGKEVGAVTWIPGN